MLKTILKLLGAVLLLCTLVLFAWYRIDGIPTPESAEYLTGSGYSVDQQADGSLVFTPDLPSEDGLVIMHGALIKPQSYAKTAAWFAKRGYTVYLPYGPGRMSIALSGSMEDRLAAFEPKFWYFIGHSMGGMASLDSIANNNINVQAVALWAAAMPVDHTALKVPILFISGNNDGLLPPEKLRQVKLNLPASTAYISLTGANHKNFALYSHQFFDNEGAVSPEAQIDIANTITADFFAQFQQE